MAKQDDYKRYTIRIPEELYDRIKIYAGDSSLNAAIIDLLNQGFGNKELNEEIDQRLTKLEEHVAEMSKGDKTVGD